MLENLENYKDYTDLVTTGRQIIYTKDLNNQNIDYHFQEIINILSDGIETPEVQNMKIHVVFPDGEVDLYIMQYMYNLMFWTLIVCSNTPILAHHIFFERIIDKRNIKEYIDKNFIRKNIGKMDILHLNQNIDRCIGKFRDLKNFQMYLANTVNFEDTIDFMKKYPEFNDTMHLDISNVPIEDVKEYGMKATRKQVEYIKKDDEDHCLKYPFMSGEGVNIKQYKEVSVNIGPKPNGQGSVFSHPIGTSFINGGLLSIEDITIDSSIGRQAQILAKQNVGQSGAFARRLGLNNQDSKLYPDETYICDTKNFETVTIKSQDILNIYDLRYYRYTENGLEYLLDADHDTDLIGKTLLFRSPMTCASAARGEGICYRCYGELAHENSNINVGQIAAEQLTAIYTQTLLSAKHLLEAAIVKMAWVKEFYNFFDVDFDQISLSKDTDFKDYKLVIGSDDIVENEYDEDDDEHIEEANYVYSFDIVDPNDNIITIRTNDSDPIYITEDFADLIAKCGDDEETYEFKLDKLKGINLFTVDIQNDELSKVMKQVKNLLDNKSSIKIHNRNSILEAFIDANLKGKIKINAIHFEVLLMNQMRAGNTLLELPDWTLKDADYSIITLEDALINNLSITVRLQSSKLKRTLIHPSNRLLHKASNMDLFTMEKPQKFMDPRYIDFSHAEPEKKIIKPVSFETERTKSEEIQDDDDEGDK